MVAGEVKALAQKATAQVTNINEIVHRLETEESNIKSSIKNYTEDTHTKIYSSEHSSDNKNDSINTFSNELKVLKENLATIDARVEEQTMNLQNIKKCIQTMAKGTQDEVSGSEKILTSDLN